MTFDEDKSRVRILPLPQILAIARNLSINLYRNAGVSNMAQAYAPKDSLRSYPQVSLKGYTSIYPLERSGIL